MEIEEECHMIKTEKEIGTERILQIIRASEPLSKDVKISVMNKFNKASER